MEVPYLLLADHASADISGKINVLGIFGRVNASVFPYKLRRMYLVAHLVFPPNEVGRERTMTIRLIDHDAKDVWVDGPNKFVVPANPIEPAMPSEAPLIVEINGLEFKSEGTHRFTIEVDNDTKATRALEVALTGREMKQ